LEGRVLAGSNSTPAIQVGISTARGDSDAGKRRTHKGRRGSAGTEGTALADPSPSTVFCDDVFYRGQTFLIELIGRGL
jgi:hypothetical protein